MPKSCFSFQKIVFTRMVAHVNGKNKKLYVLLALAKCNYVTTSFDLWVLKGAHNIFALVINFLGVDYS